MNVFAELSHREGGLIDPWDFQDPAANPPSPCRTIPITDEIRAKDAADRAAREKRPDWAIKAELRQENLHLVRRPVGPGRVEPRPRVTAAPRRVQAPKPPRPVKVPAPPRTRPTCGQCRASMAWKRTEPLCPKCSKPAPAPRKCSGCGQGLHFNVPGDTCRKCRGLAKSVKRTKPDDRRFCKCGRRLRPSNTRDTCFECAGLILNKEQRLARRVKCATPECKRLLRFPRTEGLCGVCTDRSTQRQEIVARYRARKIADAGKVCKECGVPIKWDTKTGLCAKHAAERRQCRTIIHATSLEEHRLNQLWASLSLEDKWAVLEDSLKEDESAQAQTACEDLAS